MPACIILTLTTGSLNISVKVLPAVSLSLLCSPKHDSIQRIPQRLEASELNQTF